MKIKKAELNPNIHLSEGNIKSKGTEDTMFLTWSLPSRSTCPYATTECKKRCFAKKNESFKNVRDSRNSNLAETIFKFKSDCSIDMSDRPLIKFIKNKLCSENFAVLKKFLLTYQQINNKK